MSPTRKRIAILVPGVFVVIWVVGLVSLRSPRNTPPRIIAHRAESPVALENTLAGLEYASRAGADQVEVDARMTRDGKLVLLHDANISRVAGLDRDIQDLTWEDLRKTPIRGPAGESGEFESLNQALVLAGRLNQPLVVEVKDPGLYPAIADSLLELLALHPVEATVTVISFDRDWISSLLPRKRKYFELGQLRLFTGGLSDAVGCRELHVHWPAVLLDPTLIRRAHAAGLELVVWTVNAPPLARVLGWLGVDGITSDNYEELRGLYHLEATAGPPASDEH